MKHCLLSILNIHDLNFVNDKGIQGLTAGSSALDIRYQYDVRGQLLEECRNGAAVRYAYDAAGNRIQKTENKKETRYRYNPEKPASSKRGCRRHKLFYIRPSGRYHRGENCCWNPPLHL